MNTSRITSIAPDGRPPYNSANGLLYGHRIAFEDGAKGLVNTKTEIPPYSVGDVMAYEITGKAGSNDKMKVSRPKDGFQQPRSAPPAARPAPAATPARVATQTSFDARTGKDVLPASTHINGQTVGMAMKEAIGLVMAMPPAAYSEDGIGSPTFWGKVHQYASAIIRLSNALEHGRLTPPLSSKALPGAKEPPVSQGGRSDPPKAEKPKAGPDGSVDLPVGDEDVPF